MGNVIYVKRAECMVCNKPVVGTKKMYLDHVRDCQEDISDEEFIKAFADFMEDPLGHQEQKSPNE